MEQVHQQEDEASGVVAEVVEVVAVAETMAEGKFSISLTKHRCITKKCVFLHRPPGPPRRMGRIMHLSDITVPGDKLSY